MSRRRPENIDDIARQNDALRSLLEQERRRSGEHLARIETLTASLKQHQGEISTLSHKNRKLNKRIDKLNDELHSSSRVKLLEAKVHRLQSFGSSLRHTVLSHEVPGQELSRAIRHLMDSWTRYLSGGPFIRSRSAVFSFLVREVEARRLEWLKRHPFLPASPPRPQIPPDTSTGTVLPENGRQLVFPGLPAPRKALLERGARGVLRLDEPTDVIYRHGFEESGLRDFIDFLRSNAVLLVLFALPPRSVSVVPLPGFIRLNLHPKDPFYIPDRKTSSSSSSSTPPRSPRSRPATPPPLSTSNHTSASLTSTQTRPEPTRDRVRLAAVFVLRVSSGLRLRNQLAAKRRETRRLRRWRKQQRRARMKRRRLRREERSVGRLRRRLQRLSHPTPTPTDATTSLLTPSPTLPPASSVDDAADHPSDSDSASDPDRDRDLDSDDDDDDDGLDRLGLGLRLTAFEREELRLQESVSSVVGSYRRLLRLLPRVEAWLRMRDAMRVRPRDRDWDRPGARATTTTAVALELRREEQREREGEGEGEEESVGDGDGVEELELEVEVEQQEEEMSAECRERVEEGEGEWEGEGGVGGGIGVGLGMRAVVRCREEETRVLREGMKRLFTEEYSQGQGSSASARRRIFLADQKRLPHQRLPHQRQHAESSSSSSLPPITQPRPRPRAQSLTTKHSKTSPLLLALPLSKRPIPNAILASKLLPQDPRSAFLRLDATRGSAGLSTDQTGTLFRSSYSAADSVSLLLGFDSAVSDFFRSVSRYQGAGDEFGFRRAFDRLSQLFRATLRAELEDNDGAVLLGWQEAFRGLYSDSRTQKGISRKSFLESHELVTSLNELLIEEESSRDRGLDPTVSLTLAGRKEGKMTNEALGNCLISRLKRLIQRKKELIANSNAATETVLGTGNSQFQYRKKRSLLRRRRKKLKPKPKMLLLDESTGPELRTPPHLRSQTLAGGAAGLDNHLRNALSFDFNTAPSKSRSASVPPQRPFGPVSAAVSAPPSSVPTPVSASASASTTAIPSSFPPFQLSSAATLSSKPTSSTPTLFDFDEIEKIWKRKESEIANLRRQIRESDRRAEDFHLRWKRSVAELEEAYEREKGVRLLLKKVREECEEEKETVSKAYEEQLAVMSQVLVETQQASAGLSKRRFGKKSN